MLYKDLIAIDSVPNHKKNNDVSDIANKYQLNNYSYYESKFLDDFYLKYYIHKLLFETDIMDLMDFIKYHYINCGNPEKHIKLLDFKVVPKIEEIIENAQIDMNPGRNYKVKELDEGFFETDSGVILHRKYDYSFMQHYVAALHLQKDLAKRVSIINDFIEVRQNRRLGQEQLIWTGKPSHLAYFVAKFIEEGYIEPPRKGDGDINNKELSNVIHSTFRFESNKPSLETLNKYGNVDTDKYNKLNERFSNHGFHLPHSKIMK